MKKSVFYEANRAKQREENDLYQKAQQIMLRGGEHMKLCPNCGTPVSYRVIELAHTCEWTFFTLEQAYQIVHGITPVSLWD